MQQVTNKITKRKWSIYLSICILFMILGIFLGSWFTDRYQIQSPIKKREVHIITPIGKPSPKGVQKPTTLLEKTMPKAEAYSTDKLLAEETNRSESWYKLFIYQHESGNDPAKWNSSGCVGLGQACPASKLLNVCPNLDYACEDDWFSNYATVRYGGWQGAYNFWIVNKYW